MTKEGKNLKDQINELETNCKDKNVKRTVQMHK
jgi:hypothetical protein